MIEHGYVYIETIDPPADSTPLYSKVSDRKVDIIKGMNKKTPPMLPPSDTGKV